MTVNTESKAKKTSKPISGRLLYDDELDAKIIKHLEKKDVNSSEFVRRAVRNEYKRLHRAPKRYRVKQMQTSVLDLDHNQVQKSEKEHDFTEVGKGAAPKKSSFYHDFFADWEV